MLPSFAENKVTKKVPICNSNQKVSEVKNYLLNTIPKLDTINYIYVLSKSNKLKGVLSIYELFSCPDESYIREHMIISIIKAHSDTDKEKIARLALQNNIKSIPVVDKDNTFLGVVASDEILYILEDEANEDFIRMAGIISNNIVDQDKLPVLKSVFSRIPWIILGLFGGLFAAKIIGGFQSILEKEFMLAAFIPLVAYIANAVGTQTQTLYIRKIAISQRINIIKYGLKQLLISTLIAIICWFMIGAISLVVWNSRSLGIIVGFAVFCAIIVATLFAIGIPYTLINLKKDPALGSGPFTTIIQDILSIVIYFLIASYFIL